MTSSQYSKFSRSLGDLSNIKEIPLSTDEKRRQHVRYKVGNNSHSNNNLKRRKAYQRGKEHSSELREQDRSGEVPSNDRNQRKIKRAESLERHYKTTPRRSNSFSHIEKDGSDYEIASNEKTFSRPRLQSGKCDRIDELDVTATFGRLFHHEGPFDAVAAYTNMNYKVAPIYAFPPDGANNTLGPLRKTRFTGIAKSDLYYRPRFLYDNELDMSGNEENNQYNSLYDNPDNSSSSLCCFDSKTNVKKVNGPATAGLGSSTFIDGCPASRNEVLKYYTQEKANKNKHLQFFKKS
ncbi:hypothetical protein TPHA_0H01590 [Tetrapisispora phaffii CBS 4417]|uniref:Pal1 cell morphology protein n=1 Tax=Tetrapisispora phaffii (strain ATCC 24235 / CBS 4417 / NBRC 1672 / NRRL Y-8282 / UCD 70-5) TaxID=1071381 RepID=G8BX61_TETPH|nr:hypothetical protein TPHA_0H01590 [Tetrapisispora phaffii CBS 4417]CCE64365.1 hypothetical protein TPHA_0H01590 [Tetrapisispora phaffii CBS 4417]